MTVRAVDEQPDRRAASAAHALQERARPELGDPVLTDAAWLLRLQRTVGNRAVGQFIERAPRTLARSCCSSCATGGPCKADAHDEADAEGLGRRALRDSVLARAAASGSGSTPASLSPHDFRAHVPRRGRSATYEASPRLLREEQQYGDGGGAETAGPVTSDPGRTPTDASTSPRLKCHDENFYVVFKDWKVSWPSRLSSDTTIQLPAKFRVILASGSKKEDCLIEQYMKGQRWERGRLVHDFSNWTRDGQPGHFEWWDGKNWYGGQGDWDWNLGGKDAATFYDEPGWDDTPLGSYPLYLGGAGKSGPFLFQTMLRDKETGKQVNSITWGLEIDYSAPKVGKHAKR